MPFIAMSDVRVIDFEIRTGLMFVSAQIDGQSGEFLFDTGSDYSFIHGYTLDSIVVFGGVDFDLEASPRYTEELRIGDLVHQDFEVWQTDLKDIREITQSSILGIIGNDVTEDYNIVIDYINHQILLYEYEIHIMDGIHLSDYHIVTAQLDPGVKPALELMIDNKPSIYLLDTAANVSMTISNESDYENNLSQSTVTIGAVTIEQVQFCSSKNLTNLQLEFDGVLSLSQIRLSKVIFDYSRDKILLMWRK